MIGEGILSLMIVTTDELRDYYIITVLGVLTVIFIFILKFESEPSHAEGHALWKNQRNAMCYSYLIQVYILLFILSFTPEEKPALNSCLNTPCLFTGFINGIDCIWSLVQDFLDACCDGCRKRGKGS